LFGTAKLYQSAEQTSQCTNHHSVKAKIHYIGFPEASPQAVGADKSLLASVVSRRFPNSITTDLLATCYGLGDTANYLGMSR